MVFCYIMHIFPIINPVKAITVREELCGSMVDLSVSLPVP